MSAKCQQRRLAHLSETSRFGMRPLSWAPGLLVGTVRSGSACRGTGVLSATLAGARIARCSCRGHHRPERRSGDRASPSGARSATHLCVGERRTNTSGRPGSRSTNPRASGRRARGPGHRRGRRRRPRAAPVRRAGAPRARRRRARVWAARRQRSTRSATASRIDRGTRTRRTCARAAVPRPFAAHLARSAPAGLAGCRADRPDGSRVRTQ